MKWTKRARGASAPVHFMEVFDAGNVFAENVFIPTIDFDAALVGFRQNFGNDVEIAVVGSTRLFERGIAIEFGMRRGVVAAVKIEIIFLLAVVGQRAVPYLSAGDAASIGERGEEDGIHSAFFLKDIENLFRAFVHE